MWNGIKVDSAWQGDESDPPSDPFSPLFPLESGEREDGASTAAGRNALCCSSAEDGPGMSTPKRRCPPKFRKTSIYTKDIWYAFSIHIKNNNKHLPVPYFLTETQYYFYLFWGANSQKNVYFAIARHTFSYNMMRFFAFYYNL